MPGRVVGGVGVDGECVGPQLDAPDRRHPLVKPLDPVDDIADLFSTHRRPGLVGPGFHDGPRIGVVGQPAEHPDPLPHRSQQLVLALPEVGVLGNTGQRPDIATGVPAADLHATTDQHHAECGVGRGQAVPHQLGVAGLEDPQR